MHDAFSSALAGWLRELRWYPFYAAGWTGITVLELLWQFICDTGALPPFLYEGKWCTLDDSVLNSFVLPGMPRLYRSWTRALGSVVGIPLLGGDGAEGSPGVTLGFTGLEVVGRVPLHPTVVEDLSSLFRRSCSVSSLRFPSFWYTSVQIVD